MGARRKKQLLLNLTVVARTSNLLLPIHISKVGVKIKFP